MRLVDDVFDRTQGNAYVTALIVRGLSADARSLPVGLPIGLREAATHAWHGLSTPTRELTQLIAGAGRPQRADQLQDVAATATGVRGEVVPLLREAVDGAVLDIGVGGTYWFVHPLLAEVLEQGLLPEARVVLHAAFAAALELAGDAHEMGVEAAVDLADHQFRAGHPQDAYRWALLAAEGVEQAGGATEYDGCYAGPWTCGYRCSTRPYPRSTCCNASAPQPKHAGQEDAELAAIDDLLPLLDRELEDLLAGDHPFAGGNGGGQAVEKQQPCQGA